MSQSSMSSRFRLARNPLFLLTVAVPTALAILYFGLFASDVYTSESSFVVRSPERQSTSVLGSFLRGTGFSRAQDDSFTVADYVLSWDALHVLVDQVKIDKAYGSTDVDHISRFAGVDSDKSFEALFKYYQKMVKVQTDSTSSITTLSVKAFNAKDALAVNKLLISQGEELVNRLNARGRQDMVKYAQAEVGSAESKAKAAALAVSEFRNAQGVIDPERQATIQLQQIAKLQDELIATTTQLAQLQTFTPQNPQIPAMQKRAQTLRGEIANEGNAVTGGSKSLARKAGDFQRVQLESEFANKQLVSTLASLETARGEAQRQQVYLERVSQPSLPDVAQDPKRLRSILAVLVLGLVAWGILSMLMAGVREHQD